MKFICSRILYKLLGWTKNETETIPKKYVICYAPHTSNWDFIIAMLFIKAEGRKSYYLMKKDWFFWPLGALFRHEGGIPVDRSRKQSLTTDLVKMAKEKDEFCITITPEGTRSLNPHWKHGFYYIALHAQLPILLYSADYEKKEIRCTKTFIPTGDVERDMKEISHHYDGVKGKHPEKFAQYETRNEIN